MEMQPAFSYSSYRQMILDFHQGVSWREFSRLAGYSSPVFLKLVSEGKASLSPAGVERVGAAMGLGGLELQFFRLLVELDHAQDHPSSQAIFRAMQDLARQGRTQVVDERQYAFYQSWLHPVVRELAPALGKSADARSIAAKLRKRSGITVREVSQSLALLLELGLLQVGPEGGYFQTDRNLTTGPEVRSLAVREQHRQMANLALQSVELDPPDTRDFSGLTMGLSQRGWDRVRQELAEFRRRLVSIVQEDQPVELVARLNLQLFALSEALESSSSSSAQELTP